MTAIFVSVFRFISGPDVGQQRSDTVPATLLTLAVVETLPGVTSGPADRY